MREEIYAVATNKMYRPYLGAFSLRIRQSSHWRSQSPCEVCRRRLREGLETVTMMCAKKVLCERCDLSRRDAETLTQEMLTYLGIAARHNPRVSRSQRRVPKFEKCPHLRLRGCSFGFSRSVKLTSNLSWQAEQGERSRTAGGARHIGGFVERRTVDGLGDALSGRNGSSGSKAGWTRGKG